MDVGIVTTAARKGGLFRYCTNLADALTAAGHRATLYSPGPPERASYETVATPGSAWKAALEVRRLARRHDVLHFEPVDGAPIALLAGRPYVVTVNGDDLLTRDRVDRALKARALAGARRVLPLSTFTERLFRREFPRVRAESEVLAPLPTPAPAPDSRAADALGVERFVLSVGNLVPRKGFDTLIRAGAKAGIPVVLVGTGADEPRLRAVAKEAGADARFLGGLTDAEVEGLYRRATFFALLSREEAGGRTVEGFGIVLVEAMRHTVALSTPHGGMTDVTPTDLFVADADACAAKMRALLDDPRAYEAARRACRERTERSFSTEALLPRYLAAYGKALGSAGAGR